MRDRHHILFPRQEWSLRPESRDLRNTQPLIPRIDRELHNEVHRQVPFVPLIGYHALRRVATDFYPARGTLASIDDMMLSMEKVSKHPKALPLEIGQIALAIEALDIQRTILREGGVV